MNKNQSQSSHHLNQDIISNIKSLSHLHGLSPQTSARTHLNQTMNSTQLNIAIQPSQKQTNNIMINENSKIAEQNVQSLEVVDNKPQMLNTPSNASFQKIDVGNQNLHFITEQDQSSDSDQQTDVGNYMHILKRNIVSNNFQMNKNRYGINAKSRIDDKSRLEQKLQPQVISRHLHFSEMDKMNKTAQGSMNQSGWQNASFTSLGASTQKTPIHQFNATGFNKSTFSPQPVKGKSGFQMPQNGPITTNHQRSKIMSNINQFIATGHASHLDKIAFKQNHSKTPTARFQPHFNQTASSRNPLIHRNSCLSKTPLNQISGSIQAELKGMENKQKIEKKRRVLQNTEKNMKSNSIQLSKKFENFGLEEQAQFNGSKYYRKSPRVGAGALGPNFQQKCNQFLPIIKNTNKKIKECNEIRKKLSTNEGYFYSKDKSIESVQNLDNQHGDNISEMNSNIFSLSNLNKIKKNKAKLNKEDWDSIGQDKILQATVLDDIFKKCNDYKDLSRAQQQKDYFSPQNMKAMTTVRYNTLEKIKEMKQAQEAANNQSTGTFSSMESLDSIEKQKKVYLQIAVEKNKKKKDQTKQRMEDAFVFFTNMREQGKKQHIVQQKEGLKQFIGKVAL